MPKGRRCCRYTQLAQGLLSGWPAVTGRFGATEKKAIASRPHYHFYPLFSLILLLLIALTTSQLKSFSHPKGASTYVYTCMCTLALQVGQMRVSANQHSHLAYQDSFQLKGRHRLLASMSPLPREAAQACLSRCDASTCCIRQLALLALRIGAAPTAPSVEWQCLAHLSWAVTELFPEATSSQAAFSLSLAWQGRTLHSDKALALLLKLATPVPQYK